MSTFGTPFNAAGGRGRYGALAKRGLPQRQYVREQNCQLGVA